MPRNEKINERMNKRVKELSENFNEYIEYFDKKQDSNEKIFSGPSLYFHKRTIDILRNDGIPKVFENILFFDYLYATLTAWGLHRMGETNTKLVDFEIFKKNIKSFKESFKELNGKKITELDNGREVIIQLKKIIDNLKIGIGGIKIVFNSKTIHHILPDLMPPIDRQYTLLFLYDTTRPYILDDKFSEVFFQFQKIATKNREIIDEIMKKNKDFYTGETKVIDNAIIGFVLKKALKEKKKKKD